MIRICISLFLSGIVLGAGPCLTSCGPLLISYVAGTKLGIRQGLAVWLSFSFARLIIYCLLGLLVILAKQVIFSNFQAISVRYVYLAGGIFIICIGILMMLGKWKSGGICSILNKNLIEDGMKSSFIFGLIIGLLPCAPLMSILAYVSLISKTWPKALIYCLTFSMGTLVSPLMILTVGASFIPRLVSNNPRFYLLFKLICGIVVCLLGISLIRNFYLIKIYE